MNHTSTLTKAGRRAVLTIRSCSRSSAIASRFLSSSTSRPYAQPIDLSPNPTTSKSSTEGSSLPQNVITRASTDSKSPTPTTPTPFSSSSPELSQTSPFLLTGTITRTGTMTHCVQITRQLQVYDKFLQKHYTRPQREKVHDPHPAGYLREGDVVEFGLFSAHEKEQKQIKEEARIERAAAREQQQKEERKLGTLKKGQGKVLKGGKWKVERRNKWKVRFVVRRVVTPFGVGLEERAQTLGQDGGRERDLGLSETRDGMVSSSSVNVNANASPAVA